MLECDADAAARGVFDDLFGLVEEVVVLQAATGRSHGGEVGIREHAWSARPAGGRGTQSRAASRGCECGRRAGCREEGEGTKARDVLAIDASRNVQGRERKCSQMCQRAFTERQTLGGALERGHGAPLEPLAQLGDALRSVGALSTIIEAAELVVG